MPSSPAPKRPQCLICHRAKVTCICHLKCDIHNLVEVLILQHPKELTHAKNTAGLLHLSLKNSQLIQGETFDHDYLNNLLFADKKQPLLLYPETFDEAAKKTITTNTIEEALEKSLALNRQVIDDQLNPSQLQPSQLRLVVLDATWRKSRKMLYLNPMLASLSRLSLQDTPASLYSIRVAKHENQLSTLEASCYALQQLESQQIDYAPLLTSMREFIVQRLAFVPNVT